MSQIYKMSPGILIRIARSFLVPVVLSCATPAQAQTADTNPAVAPANSRPPDSLIKSAKLEGSVQVKHDHNPFVGGSDEAQPLADASNKKHVLRSTVGATKSLANFVLDLRGFDWSKEGANAISDANINQKSESAREYLSHKKHNEKELLKAVLIMQMALYMDRDPKLTSKALVDLEKLIGTNESVDIYCALKQMNDDRSVDDEKLKLDFMQKRLLIGKVLEKAATKDPVLLNVSHRLSKYNHRGKLIQVTAKAVYSTLGLASFTPTLVAPIAETALLSFMMATGGPEQDKLLKEVYLGKILQSRCDTLNAKAHLATEGLDLAIMTGNRRLLSCTRALILDLSDDETAATVFGSVKNAGPAT